MHAPFILNDPPYGTERVYNGLRMLKRTLAAHGAVLLCGTCMDARGLADADATPGARRSTMDELSAVTVSADKVLVF